MDTFLQSIIQGLQSLFQGNWWEWVFSGIGVVFLGFLGRWIWGKLHPPPAAVPVSTPVQTSAQPITKPDLRECYLRLMAADWRILPLDVLDPDAADAAARRLTLERVYVGLDTTTPRPRELREQKDDELSYGREQPLSAVEALYHAEGKRLVLLGQPGSGKSTFARYLALTMAETLSNPGAYALTERLPGWVGGARIPVLISLGRLADSLKGAETGTADQVTDFIRRQVDGRDTLRGFGGPLLKELQDPGGLVIFDGLDEVDGSRRTLIKQAISEFAELHLRCTILVTCRVHSYRQDPGWQLEWAAEHTLADFDDPKITTFIDGWYDAQAALNAGSAIDYPDKANTLKQALDPDDPRGLRDLAGTPLLLTVMAIVHTRKELPGSRVGVYRECVDILLDRWQGAREGDIKRRPLLNALAPYKVTPRQISRGLREVAYRAHLSGERDRLGAGGRALVSGDLISGVMDRFLESPKAREVFLNYCRHANGLLLAERVVTGGDSEAEPLYVFPHLSFEEYLAARYLRDNERDCIQEAVKRAGDPAWWEVVRFLGEYLCHDEESGSIYLARALLEALCPDRMPESDEDWRRVWLAGALLPGFHREAVGDEKSAELEKHIVNRLAELLETTTALAGAPQDRAAVGRALARAGDPRPGVGLRSDGLPDLRWVRIPGTAAVRESGRFPGFAGLKLGNGVREDPEAYDNESWPEGAEPLEIDDFELAGYPVTVAQYRVFLEQGGYRENRYWNSAGHKIRDRRGWEVPEYWGNPVLTLDNHPVVGVSWYESEAYCNWLNEQLPSSQTVRLATEAEWEWAARGPEGRRYPWGDDPPKGRCNFGGSGIDRTSAVEAFPAGAGNWWQQGGFAEDVVLHDLAGNVWEWTGSEYTEDYSGANEDMNKNHASGAWVIRGGAWRNEPRDVRAARRINGSPVNRTRFIGFRLART